MLSILYSAIALLGVYVYVFFLSGCKDTNYFTNLQIFPSVFVNFGLIPMLILCLSSTMFSLLKLCFPFHSRGIAFSEWWDNVFTIEFQREIVKFHIDIRKRRVRILLIARKFVILHSIIKPWSSCCIRVVQKTSPRAFTFRKDCKGIHANFMRQNKRSSFMGCVFLF